MKVLFLDFDGVLNSHLFMLEECVQGRSGVTGLDPKAIAHVNYICGKTGAVVVVSSSWRYGRTLGELKDILRKVGCTAVVRDATPLPHEIANGQLATAFAEQGMDLTEEEAKRTLIIARDRGYEIDAWLSVWSKVEDIESFVVLDDDSDIVSHEDRHVKTSFHVGLTSEHVPLALEILSRPWRSS
jgi:HAD domain in Swiss Army Knife RNA repair proteins